MSRFKWWLLVPAGLCILGAIFVGGSLSVTQMKVGSIESVNSGWFTTLWTLIGGGTAFSLPALIALIQKWIPSLGTATDARVGQVIDAAQIGAYLFLLGKAKSPEETSALLTAGRASCDALRDGLFPVPALPAPPAPPVAVPTSPAPVGAGFSQSVKP